MDANTITVYRGRESLRVVRGEHVAHAGSKSDRITAYPSAAIALAHEKADDVRAAILRIEPDSDRVRVKVGKVLDAPAVRTMGRYEVLHATTGALLGSFTYTNVAGSREAALRGASDKVAAYKAMRPSIPATVHEMQS
jgi:hypothetical protein